MKIFALIMVLVLASVEANADAPGALRGSMNCDYIITGPERRCVDDVREKYCKIYDELKMPADLQHYVDMSAQCGYYMGEWSGDKERDDEINKAMKEIGCMGDADGEEKALREKYKDRPGYVDQAFDLQGKYNAEEYACFEK